jgi:hypothetical protein
MGDGLCCQAGQTGQTGEHHARAPRDGKPTRQGEAVVAFRETNNLWLVSSVLALNWQARVKGGGPAREVREMLCLGAWELGSLGVGCMAGVGISQSISQCENNT